jgi:hypothetical protein
MSSRRRPAKAKTKTGKPTRPAAQNRKAPQADPLEFWGDPELLPEPPEPISIPSDPKALIESLGRVPLPGHETAADHWLAMVYERAAVLGTALAAAGGLTADEKHE